MDTTPVYDLTYPSAGDDLGVGFAAIQQLAEDVEDALYPSASTSTFYVGPFRANVTAKSMTVVGNMVSLYIAGIFDEFGAGGGAITVPSDGNITNVTLFELRHSGEGPLGLFPPSAGQPLVPLPVVSTGCVQADGRPAGFYIGANGRIILTSVGAVAAGNYALGTPFAFSATYLTRNPNPGTT